LAAPHACVLKSPWGTQADVPVGAGTVAALARSAASNQAAQAVCDFVTDVVAGCEKAFAADASSANGGHWTSAGAAVVHKGVNLVAVDVSCAWNSVAAVGVARAAEGTALPAAGAARAVRAAVTADDLRTSLIFCQSLHSELCCNLLRFHHNCPRVVPNALLLRAWDQPVAQHAEGTDEFCQTAVGSLHH